VYFREEAREEGRGVGGIEDCPIYRRDTLPAGFVLAGPAVIEEPESTVLIHPGQQVRVEETGILTVTSVEDGREEAGRRGDR
jgi:N-methylhydantoinase A/oxoprolinase/acetone carboxylase beta subunit